MIDYQKNIDDQDKALEALLLKRRGITAMSSDPSSLGGMAEGIGQQFNISTPMVDPSIGQKMDLSLERLLADENYKKNRERTNLAYNRALDKASYATQNRQSQENFARQMMMDEIGRQNQASMNEKNRQQMIRQSQIQSDAFNQEKSLAQYPDPQAEYEGAVIRILSGLPSQLLSFYALNGGFGGGKSIDTTPSAGGFPGQLTAGSKWSTGIDPRTGRRV